jgi:excisionase family DNA binding protein
MQRPEDRSSARESDVLTAEEVADMLRVTPAWVYAESRRHRIPHIRLGRYIRFRREALLRWIEQIEADSDDDSGEESAGPRRVIDRGAHESPWAPALAHANRPEHRV